MSHEALGPQFQRRRIPVEAAGFLSPPPPVHDPEAFIEPTGGNRQPPGFKKVVGALFSGAVKPQPVDPTTTPIRATQDRLTPGSLRKSMENPQRRGRGGGSERDVPVLYKEGDEHYAIDGHHRIASAMLRKEQFHAVVLTPEHEQLANQYHEGNEHLRAGYRAKLDEADALARSRGKRTMGPVGSPQVDEEARSIQKEAYQHFYPPDSAYRPGYANPIRKELRLPPIPAKR